jgi:hypothetical protein
MMIGRMGNPTEKDVSVISLIVDASTDELAR